MKIFLNSLLALALAVAVPTTLSAQKIGHVDYGEILSKLPDVKRADSEIENMRKQLSKQGENLQAKINATYQEAMDKANKGQLDAAGEEAYQAKLTKMQEDLEKFAEKAEKDLAAKRDMLLKPILDKVENAVKTVAKEQGFAYIFDVSTLLYTEGGIDCTAQVKGKLGIQ